MRRTGSLIAVAVLGAAVAGCQTLSERECRAGDWTRIGRADGEEGARPTEIQRHREACARHAVTVDEAQYRSGYALGLESYCTPRGGYAAGRRGHGYHDVCRAGGGEPAFLQAFRHGQQVHRLHQEVKEVRRRAEELEHAAMMEDVSPDQRTGMRFRAEEWDSRATLKQMELESLDRKYATQYGAPQLTWSELRSR